MVSYYQRGRMWHVFVSGAVNARSPEPAVPQVHSRRTTRAAAANGALQEHLPAVRRPAARVVLAGCKASDGSYWALQMWQRMLPNLGYVPWTHGQKVWEVHVSHWTARSRRSRRMRTGSTPAASTRSSAGRPTRQAHLRVQDDEVGQPARLLRSPDLPRHARLRVRDGLATGELVRRAQAERHVLLRLLSTSAVRRLPAPAFGRLAGNGSRYRLTLYGPGVTPDVAVYVNGLPDYDKANPTLFDWETEMTSKVK